MKKSLMVKSQKQSNLRSNHGPQLGDLSSSVVASNPQTFDLPSMERYGGPRTPFVPSTNYAEAALHPPRRTAAQVRAQSTMQRARQRSLGQQEALRSAQVGSGLRAAPSAPGPSTAEVVAQIPARSNLIPVYDIDPCGERVIIALDLNGTTNFGPEDSTPPAIVVRLYVEMLLRGWIPYFLSHIPEGSKHRRTAAQYRDNMAEAVANFIHDHGIRGVRMHMAPAQRPSREHVCMIIVGDANSEGRGKLPVLKSTGTHVLVDDRADICRAALTHAGVVPYQRHEPRFDDFVITSFERGRDWMNLLKARHGALWLSNRPQHNSDHNFGHLINTIFQESTARKLAAKIECARFLIENVPPPAHRNAVSQRPPPYPRRPAGQDTS